MSEESRSKEEIEEAKAEVTETETAGQDETVKAADVAEEEKPEKAEPEPEEAYIDKTQIFALKTTTGQETNVATLIFNRTMSAKLPIYSVLVSGVLKGYIFVEAAGPHFVDDVVSGVKHARQRIPGLVKASELERYIVTKPIIDELDVEDTVEVIGGPLKGMKAKITKIDKSKNEVTLELLESTVALPITVHADHIRLVGKGKKES